MIIYDEEWNGGLIEFGIEIPDEDAEKITTVGEAIEYIKNHAAV